jgi:hypothetical protein
VKQLYLRRVLRSYLDYDHPSQTHLSPGKDAPEPRQVEGRVHAPRAGPENRWIARGPYARAQPRNASRCVRVQFVGVMLASDRPEESITMPRAELIVSPVVSLLAVLIAVGLGPSCSAGDASTPATPFKPGNPCASVNCTTHGKCLVSNVGAVCSCYNGYHPSGLSCAANSSTDPCSGVSCTGHGSCWVSATGPACRCDTAYHTSALNCIADETQDACYQVSCSGHGNCAMSGDSAVCVCSDGYHADGLDCMQNTAGNPCQGVNCSGHGTCSVVSATASCACESGYYAASPTTCVLSGASSPCDAVTCSGHGTCEVVNGVASCACSSGYHAELLECVPNSATDPCQGVSCSSHGQCVLSANQPSCSCSSGYHANGLNCDPDQADPCDGVTCSDHGKCRATGNSAACTCDSGFVPDGLNCVTPSAVNGSCGPDNAKLLISTPTQLCSAGSASAVSGTTFWTWTCAGTNGGSTAQCSATYGANGECGADQGTCTVGVSSTVTADMSAGYFWKWTCSGVGPGSAADCSTEIWLHGHFHKASECPTGPCIKPVGGFHSSLSCGWCCDSGVFLDGEAFCALYIQQGGDCVSRLGADWHNGSSNCSSVWSCY